MLTESLRDFIKSFKKESGKFTQDELYLIGIKHKELPSASKSWKELTTLVGYPGTADSYRCFVNRRQRREKIVDSLISEKVETNDVEDFDRAAYETKYKESTRARDIYNQYRSNLRYDARWESFSDELLRKIDELEPLPNIHYVSNGNYLFKEAVLMLSDLHIGVKCNNFYNKYDSGIAQKRLDKLAQDTIKYCKDNNVLRLNVCNLGDAIHGLIHVNARIEQELNTVDQIIVAAQLISDFMNKVKAAAPEVIYRSCTDNHSRPIANKSENIEEDSFEKIIDLFVSERLKDSGIKFANDNIDSSIGKFDLMNGKKIMFAHGHNDSINRTFENFIGASREFIDYALIGHYHCSKSKEFQGFNIIVNGSVVGTEQYALSHRLFSDPSQTLLIFDGDNLLNYKICLKVE